MDTNEFLHTVITTESGWFCLAFANVDKADWTEEFYRWPEQDAEIITRMHILRDDHNVYFSPYLFKEPKTDKAHVFASRTIVADLDEANLLTVPFKPTVLVETSPNRHQGYWVLREPCDTTEEHEAYSKKLTYSIPRCDRTGWFLGKKVRLPDTWNYKYVDGRKSVRVVANSGMLYGIVNFESLPPVSVSAQSEDSESIDAWISIAEDSSVGPYEILEKYRSKLPAKVVVYYDRQADNRSDALWALTTSLFRAGATKEEVYWVALESANNKFADLRFGGKRELAKDVLRAQTAAQSDSSDLRTKILQLRRLPGLASEKRAYIANVIRESMEKIGSFVHCTDGSVWYIRTDLGRPIQVIQRGEGIQILLDTLFGLNATEQESSFVINHLITYGAGVMQAGVVSSLTYYDTDTKTLLIHTGRKDVLSVTADKITTVVDGYHGVVFPWMPSNEEIAPRYSDMELPWYEILFGDCLDNLVNMEREHAMALLRTWVVMLLLRNSVVSRPILAIFGQPGSGKSTLFRRLYTLLYGRHKALGAVSNPDDFDFACANDPLVVLDNVDTGEKWLPDRLALAAAASDLTKRKLYTNGEVVTLKRSALLGITAHNPQFGREDVNDRLILLTFQRLSIFRSETDILNNIFEMRAAIWGAIVQDVQLVLASAQPKDAEIPQFRVQDFARCGLWIARACGIADQFIGAITSLRDVQKAFTLEEDGILMDAIERWLAVANNPAEYRTPGQIWPLIEAKAVDSQEFKKRYRNAVALGKKLWALQDALKSVYDVDWRYNTSKGSREWKIVPKGTAAPRITEINKSA